MLVSTDHTAIHVMHLPIELTLCISKLIVVIVKSVAKVHFDASDFIALPPSPTPHSVLVDRAKEHPF